MSKIKLAVLGSLLAISGTLSTQVMAAGFATLPTSGTSAYVSCRSGNGFEGTFTPLADSACLAPNAINASGFGVALLFASVPESGFAAFAPSTASSAVTAFGETLATLNERVWRNASTSECIYGKQVIMNNAAVADYNSQIAGTQKMEVNDIAFGGYTGAVSAAYGKQLSVYASVLRIGRTFTSVQRQTSGSGLCPGFLQLPTIGGVPGTEINGVGLVPVCSVIPTAAQQEAPLSASWVDFTTLASAGTSPEGWPSTPASPNMYIKQACASGAASAVANSLKLRQTGRQYQPWVVVTGTSRAPSNNIVP